MNRPWSLLIVVDRGIEPLCQDWESCILTIRWIDLVTKICIGLTTFADLYQHIFNIVVDRGIEPLCQDWESCILTIRWIDQRCNFELSLRKVGDSNPRYGNPHVSLANWWFQPLTQPSNRILLPNQQASFSNAGAKILHFFCSTKFFCNFFQEKCIFSYFSCFLGRLW